MAKQGADVEELNQLATKMKTEADQIEQAGTKIDQKLNSTWWEGPDAKAFKADWDGKFKSQLKRIAGNLRDAGEHVKKQADQQRTASSAG